MSTFKNIIGKLGVMTVASLCVLFITHEPVFAENISDTTESVIKELEENEQYIGEPCHMFAQADTSSKILGTLWTNSVIEVVEKIDNNWLKVNYAVFAEDGNKNVAAGTDIEEMEFDQITGYIKDWYIKDDFTEFVGLTPRGDYQTYLYVDNYHILFPAGRIYDQIDDHANYDLSDYKNIQDMREWYVISTSTDNLCVNGFNLASLYAEDGNEDGYITLIYSKDGANDLTALKIHGAKDITDEDVFNVSYTYKKGTVTFLSNENVPFDVEVGFYVGDDNYYAKDEVYTLLANGQKINCEMDENGFVWARVNGLKTVKLLNWVADDENGLPVTKDMTHENRMIILSIILIGLFTCIIAIEIFQLRKRK